MVIENASPALAAFVKQAIVAEMATVLKSKHINLDDDGAVAVMLYSASHSSCAIAALMDEARLIARRTVRSLVAAAALVVSSTVATTYTTVIASDAIGPSVVEIVEALAPSVRSHAARIPA